MQLAARVISLVGISHELSSASFQPNFIYNNFWEWIELKVRCIIPNAGILKGYILFIWFLNSNLSPPPLFFFEKPSFQSHRFQYLFDEGKVIKYNILKSWIIFQLFVSNYLFIVKSNIIILLIVSKKLITFTKNSKWISHVWLDTMDYI